jgi:hypothetical protein
MGVEEGADGSDTGALDVQGKWGDGRGRLWWGGSREGKGRLGKDLTGGLHLSGEKNKEPGVTVRERTEWAIAGLAGLGCSVHFFFIFFFFFLFILFWFLKSFVTFAKKLQIQSNQFLKFCNIQHYKIK